jgi:class 3 adenylate cyclase
MKATRPPATDDLRFEWRWTFGAPPEVVWPVIADTERFNRAAGIPPVTFEMMSSPERGIYRVGRVKQGSRWLVWDEHPFDFEEPRRFSVLRRYHSGPVAEAEFMAELAPKDGGTELTYRIRVRSRRPADVARNRRDFTALKKSFDKAYRSAAKHLTSPAPTYPEPPALGASFRADFREALASLPHSERLIAFLTEAAAPDLVRMRPFRLARLWDIPRDEALRVFLNATLKGVLEASWVLLCPSCRGTQAQAPQLSELRPEGHCDSCQADFTADFDRLMELTFRVAPQWKVIEMPEYCVGGPGRMPHVAAQFPLGRGQTAQKEVRLSPGAYRAKAFLSGRAVPVEVVDGGPSQISMTATAEGVTPPDIRIGSPCRIEVVNRLPQDSYLAIERTAWADDACSAAYVSCFQDYRDLFSRDVLAPGVAVKVAEVTVLFTDLKDSTATYGRLGDASAFGLVRDHFSVLTAIVRTHEGAIVKTIGDAIMAVFLDPARALTAGFAMHDAIARLRAPDGQPVILKVGLHAGPCFAVTLNERLDYFGTVVNLAARIQSQSIGGDTVLEEGVSERPAVARLLAGRPMEKYEAELKGIQGVRRLVRVGTPL